MRKFSEFGFALNIQSVAVLVIVCIASAASLGALNSMVRPKINQSEQQQKEEALASVFPNGEFEELENEVYRVTEGGQLVGYASVGSGRGYGGFSGGLIYLAVGIRTDGTVKGVEVIRQSETPGLGSRITEDWFLNNYENLKLEEIRLQQNGGEVVAITGATISSEGAVDIVREEVKQLRGYLTEAEG